MLKKIKWGIIGTGNISRQFAEGLSVLEDAELVAIGSRSQESAQKFAAEFDIAKTYGSYEDMVKESEAEVVYIATPHPFHFENVMLCLDNGKNVLCEKPFAMNGLQVQQMIDKAESKGLFLMEAMWMAYFPAIAKIRELISSGVIGKLKFVQANINFDCGWQPESHLLNKEIGGGTLLGLGVYAVSFAQLIYGAAPVEISTLPFIGTTGVDEHAVMIFKYKEGGAAVLNSGIQVEMPQDALIAGTKGMIKIPQFFWQPDTFTLCVGDKEEEFSFERIGNGYCFEAIEVMKCLCQGKKQSELISWNFSLNAIETIDKVRAQWGLKYPCE
jgi:dihydrodiol dehydrogenase / D-xylose 1-dehydrogenase (NADP)